MQCRNFHPTPKLWELLRRVLVELWPCFALRKLSHYPHTGTDEKHSDVKLPRSIPAFRKLWIRILTLECCFVEPIGGAKPQFNSKSESWTFKTETMTEFSLMCPAQAFPLPSFRWWSFFKNLTFQIRCPVTGVSNIFQIVFRQLVSFKFKTTFL